MPTGKCIKAAHEIYAREAQIRDAIITLESIAAILRQHTGGETSLPSINLAVEPFNSHRRRGLPRRIRQDPQTRGGELIDLPARIEFSVNGLWLYIDFLLVPSGSARDSDFQGCIVYGAQRPECFASCTLRALHAANKKNDADAAASGEENSAAATPEPNTDTPENCTHEQIPCHDASITRCDGLLDKALLKLVVDRDGRISESDKLNDEWWVPVCRPSKADDSGKPEDPIIEMHYRALAAIQGDVLNWVNELLIP